MTVNIYHGDCLKIIPELFSKGVMVDSCVCDPPYHLTDMTKRFGKKGSSPAKSPLHQRVAKGFMSTEWDGGDIAFRTDTWATIATIMRPGAFLLAFGGTRTYHRLVCAIEDAGFIIQDAVLWLYGQGFPKRKDMLKPAVEMICLAYKPGGRRTLQVDECKIGVEQRFNGGARNKAGGNSLNMSVVGMPDDYEGGDVVGRWPANVCHDGSEEVLEAFAAFGESKSAAGVRGGTSPAPMSWGQPRSDGNRVSGHDDSGSAARFFYSAKADAQDRWNSHHPTVKPVELMRWLVSLVTPKNGLVLDPFSGSGTTGAAAMITERNAILIEKEDQYVQDILDRIEFLEKDENYRVFQNADKSQAKADINSLKNAPEKGWWKD